MQIHTIRAIVEDVQTLSDNGEYGGAKSVQNRLFQDVLRDISVTAQDREAEMANEALKALDIPTEHYVCRLDKEDNR